MELYELFLGALKNCTEKNIKELILVNNCRNQVFDTPMFKEITKGKASVFKNIEKLQLTWCFEMIEKEINCFVDCFPRLQELLIGCSPEFSEECIEKIIKKLPNIRRVHFGHENMEQYVDFCIDSEFFNIDRQEPLEIDCSYQMSKSLKRLENIWIPADEEKGEIIIRNMKNLKELSIGSILSETNDRPILESTSFFKSIAAKVNLISLSLCEL